MPHNGATVAETLRPFVAWVVVAAALTVGMAPGASGQAVRGEIRDSVTGQPVPSADISLLDTTGAVVTNTQSDRDGRFSLAAGRGSYQIRARRLGYHPAVSAWLRLTADTSFSQTILLSPLPQVLEPALVRGIRDSMPGTRPIEGRRIRDFYERLRNPARTGRFVTVEQIEQWNPRTTIDILRRVRGVKIEANPAYGSGDLRRFLVFMSRSGTTTFISRRGICPPLYFLDALYMGNAETTAVEDLVSPEQIEGVEVYAGAGEMPPEFNRMGSQCGVIAFWTR